jgi:hypothetical protein
VFDGVCVDVELVDWVAVGEGEWLGIGPQVKGAGEVLGVPVPLTVWLPVPVAVWLRLGSI